MTVIARAYLRAVQYLDAKLKSASIRLTKWTGKSSERIHPKHLAGLDERHHWYANYMKPTDVVLDVGCGSAVHTVRAARQCRLAIGLDRNGSQLAVGRRLANGRGVGNLRLLKASAEANLPFPSGTFDKVLLLDVLEHLHQRRGALREIRRVLREDGALFVAAPNRDTSRKRRLREAGLFHYGDPDHKIEYSQEELAAELAGGGFRIEGELAPVVYDTAWAGLIDFVGGLSLGAYRRLSRWKRDIARRHPEESTGWQMTCGKLGEIGEDRAT
jgi:SAM-dependent methyltransferase